MTFIVITISFDFWNTRLKYLFFANDQMTHIDVLEQGSVEEVARVLETQGAEKGTLISVVSYDPVLEDLLAVKPSFHKLSHISQLPLLFPWVSRRP